MTVAYGQTTVQQSPKPKSASRLISQTKKNQAHELYAQAKSCTSLPGEICKFTGAMGAAVGAALTIVTMGSGNPMSVFVSGSATIALAMAGAPIAAIGSMATQTKRQTKFAELDAWLAKQGMK